MYENFWFQLLSANPRLVEGVCVSGFLNLGPGEFQTILTQLITTLTQTFKIKAIASRFQEIMLGGCMENIWCTVLLSTEIPSVGVCVGVCAGVCVLKHNIGQRKFIHAWSWQETHWCVPKCVSKHTSVCVGTHRCTGTRKMITDNAKGNTRTPSLCHDFRWPIALHSQSDPKSTRLEPHHSSREHFNLPRLPVLWAALGAASSFHRRTASGEAKCYLRSYRHGGN